MSRGEQHLVPSSLYITISLPRRQIERLRALEIIHNVPPAQLPADFDPGNYETACAQGRRFEEFDWGLYVHRGLRDGTWYALHRNETVEGGSCYGGFIYSCFSPFRLVRREMEQSPRLHQHVVGLVRMLSLSPGPGPSSPNTDNTVTNTAGIISASQMTRYFDWLTGQTAPQATRSFI
jgi:hypothetical protein